MAQELIDKIRAAAQAKNVDPDVAVRIAQNESSLDPAAKAKTSSAAGLFGVIDKTWREQGGRPGQKLNPDENIRVGTNLIASNTDFLRKNLGREPSPTEVYSAHFFGPTGASAFLSAAPNTPAVDVLGAKVIKANPQLQGKTVGEVKQMLSGKMGETAPAPATTQTKAAPPTDSQQMMEGALRSGMSAKAEDLGSGYKAALALSFLGAEDADKPESDADLQARLDREEEDQNAAELAAYKPYNALKDLQLSASSHLKTMFPQLEAEPVHMAAGGLPFTPTATVKGTARDELDAIKAQYDKYNTDADAYNTALNKYKAEQYDPYITAIQKYNDAATLWNQGPRTTAFGMTKPTAPKDFSMTAPTAPGVSQADYEAKGAAAQADAKSRQLALSAVEDPERYGLTINKFFADGGAVMGSNTPLNVNPMMGTGAMMLSHGGVVYRADGSPEEGEVTGVNKVVDFIAQRLNPSSFPTSARTLLETVQGNKGPITESNFSPEEHEIMRQLAAIKGGKQGSIDYGDYVKLGEQMKKAGKIPASVTPGLLSMTDPMGNVQTTLGRFSYKTDPKGNLQVVDRYDFNPIYDQGATQEAQTGDYGALSPYGLIRNYAGQKIPPGKGREVLINLGPVKRADGSPEQGEIGFFNPNIQRQGAKARALAQKRDVNLLPDPKTYAAVSGLMGTPPDQMGFSVLHPQYREIQQVADPAFWMGTALGVAPAVSLAGKGVSKAARMLEDVTVGNAQRQRIREAGQLAQNLPSTVYDPLRERLQAQGSLAYAVREPGGPLLQVPQRTSHTWVDNKTGKALEQVDPLIPIMHDLAGTPDQPLNEWFRNKVGSYIRRDLGTEKDQFVKAADEGRRLHFMDKPPSSMTLSQAARETPHSVRYVRESEGFPAEGFAQTPYGRMVEAKTDWSIWPMEAKTLLGDEDEKLLLPIVRDMAKQNPNLRVHEINPQIEEHLGLTSLRDKMFKMRQMSPDFAAYNQPAVKVPERYMFTDKTLQGLTPAQASERVAQFDTWKQETKQKMASQAVLKDPAVDRAPASNGHVWVNAPDLEDNPALRNLIQDVGCDGGWCTKNDYQAVNNGSGPNRLSVLMDSKARPKVQMTITTKSPTTDDFLISMADDEAAAFKANNPDVALYDDNSIRSTPEYQQWARMNPESVSITELKAVNNRIDMKDAPFLKQVQDRIKQLDAQVGLQHVDNLDGIGMTDLTSQLYGHSSIANRPKIGQQNMMWIADEAARLNGGSRYVEKDKGVIDSLLQQAANNILGPEGHATGGLIERQNTDNRRYL